MQSPVYMSLGYDLHTVELPEHKYQFFRFIATPQPDACPHHQLIMHKEEERSKALMLQLTLDCRVLQRNNGEMHRKKIKQIKRRTQRSACLLKPFKSSVRNLKLTSCPALMLTPRMQTGLTPTLPSGGISLSSPTLQRCLVMMPAIPGSAASR